MYTALRTATPSPGAPPSTAAAPSRLERLKAQPRKQGEASFFFWDAHFKNDAVKVLPGEFFVHDEDILVMTTLGSCIAACIWDREKRIGGMNHFLLPDGGSGGGADGGRYGSYAMDLLIGELVKRGATRSTMEAKIFGGGAVISGMNTINVGERNIEQGWKLLDEYGFQLQGIDVGEDIPRTVTLDVGTGEVTMRRGTGRAPVNQLAAAG